MASLMRALIIDGRSRPACGSSRCRFPGPARSWSTSSGSAICGTDVELFTRELAYFDQGKSSFPLCPGHEWCGTVSAVGAGVDEAWAGQRVTGDTMLGCGHCRRCASGRHHVCADRREIGIIGWPGALAEKLLVPAGSLYRLPAEVDDAAGALVEPGGNALRAVAAAHAGPGKRLLVWGPGSIGLLAAAFARAAGAEVDVVGLDSGREELAKSFGASRYWTTASPPPGTYDAVIDCTGDEAVPAAGTAVRRAGRPDRVHRAVEEAQPGRQPRHRAQRHHRGRHPRRVGGPGAAIEHYADGRVDPRPLAQVVVGLERAAERPRPAQLDTGAGTKIHVDPRR